MKVVPALTRHADALAPRLLEAHQKHALALVALCAPGEAPTLQLGCRLALDVSLEAWALLDAQGEVQAIGGLASWADGKGQGLQAWYFQAADAGRVAVAAFLRQGLQRAAEFRQRLVVSFEPQHLRAIRFAERLGFVRVADSGGNVVMEAPWESSCSSSASSLQPSAPAPAPAARWPRMPPSKTR